MQASDFDYTADCKACGGVGDIDGYDGCPSCNGRHDHGTDPPGTVNRLESAQNNFIRIEERVNLQGYVIVEQMPIRDDNGGGLEGRFGSWTPADIDSGAMANYQPDTRDALQNQFGNTGPYEVYGRTVAAADFGGAWPSPDMTAQEVRDWALARGDDNFAGDLQQLIDEPNSPW